MAGTCGVSIHVSTFESKSQRVLSNRAPVPSAGCRPDVDEQVVALAPDADLFALDGQIVLLRHRQHQLTHFVSLYSAPPDRGVLHLAHELGVIPVRRHEAEQRVRDQQEDGEFDERFHRPAPQWIWWNSRSQRVLVKKCVTTEKVRLTLAPIPSSM